MCQARKQESDLGREALILGRGALEQFGGLGGIDACRQLETDNSGNHADPPAIASCQDVYLTFPRTCVTRPIEANEGVGIEGLRSFAIDMKHCEVH